MCGLVSLLLHAVCLSALIFGSNSYACVRWRTIAFFIFFGRSHLDQPRWLPTVMRPIYATCTSVALTRVQDRQPVTFHPGRYPSPGAI